MVRRLAMWRTKKGRIAVRRVPELLPFAYFPPKEVREEYKAYLQQRGAAVKTGDRRGNITKGRGMSPEDFSEIHGMTAQGRNLFREDLMGQMKENTKRLENAIEKVDVGNFSRLLKAREAMLKGFVLIEKEFAPVEYGLQFRKTLLARLGEGLHRELRGARDRKKRAAILERYQKMAAQDEELKHLDSRTLQKFAKLYAELCSRMAIIAPLREKTEIEKAIIETESGFIENAIGKRSLKIAESQAEGLKKIREDILRRQRKLNVLQKRRNAVENELTRTELQITLAELKANLQHARGFIGETGREKEQKKKREQDATGPMFH